MNSYFFENFSQNLISEQFKPINFNFKNNDIILFFKQIGSNLYIIFPSKFLNEETKELDKIIIEKFNKTYINKIFFIEILIFEKLDEILIKYSYNYADFENKLIKLIWLVDTKNEKIIINGNQPSDILNIQNLINSAFLNTFNNKSINQMVEENNIKNINNLKSKNIYLTLALILILFSIYIFAFLTNTHLEIIFKVCTTPDMFSKKEFYRIFSHAFFHSNFSHLLSNCLSLYIFGSRVEKYMGKLNFIIIYLLGIIISFLGSYFINKGYSIGASGAIFALEGAILYFVLKENKKVDGLDFNTLLILSIVSIFIGISRPNVDNAAHIFGFFSGIIVAFFIKKIQCILNKT